MDAEIIGPKLPFVEHHIRSQDRSRKALLVIASISLVDLERAVSSLSCW